MRSSCREYLHAVQATQEGTAPPTDFEPALVQLREMFRTVALHVSALYKLPAAAQLIGGGGAAIDALRAGQEDVGVVQQSVDGGRG
jgi:hypothetical protein